MRDVVYRFSIVVVFLLTFGMLSGLVLAQEPPSLEISLVPQTDFALAGQPFTYTLMVTNTGPAATGNIIIFAQTPTGTTFVRASDIPNWAVSGLPPGETGNILWTPREPVAPGVVVKFELVVNVLPEMAHQQLISNQYGFALTGSNDVSVSDRVVTVEVFATSPTPTPLPTVTPTIVPTPTFTAIPTPTFTPEPTLAVLAPGPSPVISTPVSGEATLASPSVPWSVLGLGLVGAGLLLSGMVWYFKRQRS